MNAKTGQVVWDPAGGQTGIFPADSWSTFYVFTLQPGEGLTPNGLPYQESEMAWGKLCLLSTGTQAYFCKHQGEIIIPYNPLRTQTSNQYVPDRPGWPILLAAERCLNSLLFWIPLKFFLNRFSFLLLELLLFGLGLPLYHLGRGALEAFLGGGASEGMRTDRRVVTEAGNITPRIRWELSSTLILSKSGRFPGHRSS